MDNKQYSEEVRRLITEAFTAGLDGEPMDYKTGEAVTIANFEHSIGRVCDPEERAYISVFYQTLVKAHRLGASFRGVRE